jgi:hypothetical protein
MGCSNQVWVIVLNLNNAHFIQILVKKDIKTNILPKNYENRLKPS